MKKKQGLALSEMILEENKKNPIPLGFMKDIFFHIGVVYYRFISQLI